MTITSAPIRSNMKLLSGQVLRRSRSIPKSSSAVARCFSHLSLNRVNNDNRIQIGSNNVQKLSQFSLPISSVIVPSHFLQDPSRSRWKYNFIGHFSSASVSTTDFTDEEISDSGSSALYRNDIRNVAIVAHVDHGKTTLVDELLRLAAKTSDKGSDKENDEDEEGRGGKLVMDSGELEMERGITITSKVTRLMYRENQNGEAGHIINVVDTPGHADFAGEVDRILGMVSGVCLLIDAAEGCMAQTKYVLSRALSLGLKPICVLNKLDRPGAMQRVESGEVESELLDLFDDLGATEEQMDYLTVYASGKGGWATLDESVAAKLASGEISKDEETTMHVLFKAILEQIPPPQINTHKQNPNESDSFSMAATNVGYDAYLGRTCTGRIYSGSIKVNDSVLVLPRARTDPTGNNEDITSNNNTSTASGIFVNRGVSRAPLESGIASAGDIVTIAGVPEHMKVGDTLTSASNPIPQCIETPPLAPPTLSMDFGANSSPLMGKEGSIITSSRIRSRLEKETDNNVTLQTALVETDAEKTRVYGRGELQLGILIEQMRREGFEITISPPQVVTRVCPETNKTLEPYEEVIIDVDDEYAGTIVNTLTNNTRGGILMNHQSSSSGTGGMQNKTRLIFEMPSRGLLGFNSEIATLSRGSAVLNHTFIEDRPVRSNASQGHNEKGKLISSDS